MGLQNYHINRTLEQYKACLVVEGHTQQKGIDYLDTFSPVTKLIVAKVFLSLTAIFGWSIT